MITYRREPLHDYTMDGVCGVLFEGEMHFFGGAHDYSVNLIDLSRQHFVIETQRNGQLAKMTRKENLEIGFLYPSCSSFDMTTDFFPWSSKTVAILCFDENRPKSCYSFDGKLTYMNDSNNAHLFGKLAKYSGNLLTVGGATSSHQKTEIMIINENKNFSWSVVEEDFKFTRGLSIYFHSLVTVKSSDINEEYVLLIGGYDGQSSLADVFKFNGTWTTFGKLNRPRHGHNSIYWNGAVYIIGGEYPYNVQSSFENFTYAYEEGFFAGHESSGDDVIALLDSFNTYM